MSRCTVPRTVKRTVKQKKPGIWKLDMGNQALRAEGVSCDEASAFRAFLYAVLLTAGISWFDLGFL